MPEYLEVMIIISVCAVAVAGWCVIFIAGAGDEARARQRAIVRQRLRAVSEEARLRRVR